MFFPFRNRCEPIYLQHTTHGALWLIGICALRFRNRLALIRKMIGYSGKSSFPNLRILFGLLNDNSGAPESKTGKVIWIRFNCLCTIFEGWKNGSGINLSASISSTITCILSTFRTHNLIPNLTSFPITHPKMVWIQTQHINFFSKFNYPLNAPDHSTRLYHFIRDSYFTFIASIFVSLSLHSKRLTNGKWYSFRANTYNTKFPLFVYYKK